MWGLSGHTCTGLVEINACVHLSIYYVNIHIYMGTHVCFMHRFICQIDW